MDQSAVVESGYAAVSFHTENNLLRLCVAVDCFQGGEHVVQAVSVYDAVGIESCENPEIADAEFGGNVDDFGDFADLSIHIVAREIISGTAAFQTDVILPEQGFDLFDLFIGRTDLKRILVVIGDGELQQIKSEAGGYFEL